MRHYLDFLTLAPIMGILNMFFPTKSRFLTNFVDFLEKDQAGGYSEDQYFESFSRNA